MPNADLGTWYNLDGSEPGYETHIRYDLAQGLLFLARVILKSETYKDEAKIDEVQELMAKAREHFNIMNPFYQSEFNKHREITALMYNILAIRFNKKFREHHIDYIVEEEMPRANPVDLKRMLLSRN